MVTERRAAPAGDAVETRILEFIQGELLGPDTSVGRDDDLLSGALLDSMGVVRLAAFVEQAFELEMKPSDLVIENFRSVSVLAEFVRRSSSEKR